MVVREGALAASVYLDGHERSTFSVGKAASALDEPGTRRANIPVTESKR